MVTPLTETFGLNPLIASLTISLTLLLLAAAAAWVIRSAPPRTLTLSSGPPGSTFERFAGEYQKALAEHGINLKLVPSGGSKDNLARLMAPGSGIDIGFVQGGLVGDQPPAGLVSLGSLSFQPVMICYRAAAPISRLAELAGHRIGVGLPGSGAQQMARTLLEANGITGAPSVLVEAAPETEAADLLEGRLDAVFLMGDSAPTQTIRTLIRTPGVQIYHCAQADAYVRKLPFLHRMVLPEGSLDFGRNLPAQDTVLVGPAIELIAREDLNSALTDLLLGIAQKVHGKPGVLARRGEFPAPLESEFTLSPDALRYYKDGQGLTYKLIGSFWLANLVNRLIVAVLPVLFVLIPAMRLIPAAYRWSVQLRIFRCYRALLTLERELMGLDASVRREELHRQLGVIEHTINGMRVPASFASQFYEMRSHLNFVRERLGGAG